MTHVTRHWKLIAGLFVVGALVVVATWPRAEPVDVALVTRGAFEVTVDAEGMTRVRHRFVVSAPVAGRLLRVLLEPGDEVRRDETVIATLMPTDPLPLDARSRAEAEAAVAAARAAVDRAEAEVVRAEVDVERARRDVDRHRPLHEAGVVTDDEFEFRQAALRASEETRHVAERARDVARRDIDLARARLVSRPADRLAATIDLRSPIDGVVLRRSRESEAVVPAGEPIVEVGDATDLEIVADLLSTDAVRVGPGTRVRVAHWGGPGELAARVRRVEPSGFTKVSALGVEEQRVYVVAEFIGTEHERRALGDGYRVEVRLVVSERTDVLRVPTSALFRHDGGWAVYVVDADRARRQVVGIGERNGLEAEVVDGLAEGDIVIVHPPDTIDEGRRVAARSSR